MRPADAPLVRMRDGHGGQRPRTLHVIDLRDGRTVNEVHTSRRIPFLLAAAP